MRKLTAGVALASLLVASGALAPAATAQVAAPGSAVLQQANPYSNLTAGSSVLGEPATPEGQYPAGYGAAGAQLAVKKPYTIPAEYEDNSWRAIVADIQSRLGAEAYRLTEETYYSPAMNRDIPLIVIRAKKESGPRPTIYLLNGAGGGEQPANWVKQTDAIDFYLGKDVNVVIPMRGAFTYYTDWVSDPAPNPIMPGPQKWETFLAKELPGAIEPTLNATGKRGIIGMSMSATSSLLITAHNPSVFDAVGSFSGCASTSDPISWKFMELTLERAGQNPTTMWGPRGGDVNRYNDVLIQSGNLRGKAIYVTNGSGIASERDMPPYIMEKYGVDYATALNGTMTLVIEGGAIEAATNGCTALLKSTLDRQGIPATFNFRPNGVHSWSYWQQDLHESWPVMAAGLGIA